MVHSKKQKIEGKYTWGSQDIGVTEHKFETTN